MPPRARARAASARWGIPVQKSLTVQTSFKRIEGPVR